MKENDHPSHISEAGVDLFSFQWTFRKEKVNHEQRLAETALFQSLVQNRLAVIFWHFILSLHQTVLLPTLAVLKLQSEL
jgi:hypothetical protein